MFSSVIGIAIRDGSIGGMHVGASETPNTVYKTSEVVTINAILHGELCKNIELALDNGYLSKRKFKNTKGSVADQYSLTDLAKKYLVQDGEIQYKLLDVAMPEWKRDWYEDTFKI